MVIKHMFLHLTKLDLKNNQRVYLPYGLALTICIASFYALSSISSNPSLQRMTSGSFMTTVFFYGIFVLGLFCVLFLFHLNSFLARYRNQAFRFYTSLGMEKKHICRIIFYETFYIYFLSTILGMALGYVLSHEMAYACQWIMQGKKVMAWFFSIQSCYYTIGFFFLLTCVLCIDSMRRIHVIYPSARLNEKAGEESAQSKPFVALLGLVCLICAYALAGHIEDPLTALRFFVLALLLAVIGTYCFFEEGYFVFLKLLRQWKWYQFQSKHMMGTAHAIAFIKKEGKQLANICILTTMVLILLSSTVTLWSGMNQILDTKNPRDVILQSVSKKANLEDIQALLEENKIEVEKEVNYEYLSVDLYKQGNQWKEGKGKSGISQVTTFEIITLDTFDFYEKSNAKLEEDEVILYAEQGWNSKDIRVLGSTFHVKNNINAIFNGMTRTHQAKNVCYMVVNSKDTLKKLAKKQSTRIRINYGFNLKDSKQKKKVERLLHKKLKEWNYYPRYVAYKNYIGFYGAFLFVGIFVSVLLLVATILSLFYQQILDGYEDRERYQNMQSLGLEKEQIKKNVRSQLALTFFLPLLGAGIHLIFSFRLMNQLLRAAGLVNTTLLMQEMISSFLLFLLIYILIYQVVAWVYYRTLGIKD